MSETAHTATQTSSTPDGIETADAEVIRVIEAFCTEVREISESHAAQLGHPPHLVEVAVWTALRDKIEVMRQISAGISRAQGSTVTDIARLAGISSRTNVRRSMPQYVTAEDAQTRANIRRAPETIEPMPGWRVTINPK